MPPKLLGFPSQHCSHRHLLGKSRPSPIALCSSYLHRQGVRDRSRLPKSGKIRASCLFLSLGGALSLTLLCPCHGAKKGRGLAQGGSMESTGAHLLLISSGMESPSPLGLGEIFQEPKAGWSC